MTERALTTHEELAADLGFRVDASQDQLLYGDNPRPSTREENLLWGRAVQAKAAFRGSQKKNAELEADNKSLRASCEAYRQQLEKLYEGIKYIVHIESTDDAVEKALALINVAHNQPQAAEAAEQRRYEYLQRKISGEQVQK